MISNALIKPVAELCDMQAQGLEAIKPEILRTDTSFPLAGSATPMIANKKRRQELLESIGTMNNEQQ